MGVALKQLFKDDYRWWATVKLFRRNIFITLIVAVPRNLVSSFK